MYRILIYSFLFFAIDQLSKWLVVFFLQLGTKLTIDLNNQFLNFHMAWNKGINFGLFESESLTQVYFLFLISVLISLALFFWVRKTKNYAIQLSSALVIGGAVGNAIDRLLYGSVADFINLTCCGVKNPFSFNLADVFIFIGIIGLIYFRFDEDID
ncbi:signal peptidase II [bacterium TMED277]|nr:MAG: signal peptidase II [bacterium TMED277]